MRRMVIGPILLGVAFLVLGALVIADGRTFNGACSIGAGVCCFYIAKRLRVSQSQMRSRGYL